MALIVSNRVDAKTGVLVTILMELVVVQRDGWELFAVRFVLKAFMVENVLKDVSVPTKHCAITSPERVVAQLDGKVNSVLGPAVKVNSVLDVTKTVSVKMMQTAVQLTEGVRVLVDGKGIYATFLVIRDISAMTVKWIVVVKIMRSVITSMGPVAVLTVSLVSLAPIPVQLFFLVGIVLRNVYATMPALVTMLQEYVAVLQVG